jgi:hypothetical protein
MTAGSVNLAQARVITEALEALPADDIEAALLAKAEAHLLAEAAQQGPRELKILGAKLLEVIAPDIAEQADYERLLAGERRAEAATTLTGKHRGDGSVDVHARLPEATWDRLRTYLDAYTNPRRTLPDNADAEPAGEVGEVEALPIARRRGIAFCAFLENVPATGLPQHGGTATSVMVTLDHDTLLSGVGVATTDSGGQLTVGQVRRLACAAGIIAVVLGAKGEILDLGRLARLFNAAQRRAMALRDKHCTAVGCSVPAAWCHAHHKKPWSRGGRTDLADGTLLCAFHHQRAHDPRWDPVHHPDGTTTFTRRE